MSRLLCCLRARPTMGGALSHPQEGEACDGGGAPAAPPTMADVIRERKKKAGGAGLGTLRRRIAAAARRPRDNRPDRGCEHARFIRSVVSSWRLVEVFLLSAQLEAGAALRDLSTQAELARAPASSLPAHLARALTHRWWCDVELAGAGWSVAAHRAVLAARCSYFRDLLHRHPHNPSCWRVPLEGAGAALSRAELEAVVLALYAGARRPLCAVCAKWERGAIADGDLDIISGDIGGTYGRTCGCGRSGGSSGSGGSAGPSLRRLGALLGFSPDTLQQDMRYLLESGSQSDARLVFASERGPGPGAQFGFRAALDLPCHRVVLAARSRFFRSVMSRRTTAGSNCASAQVSVCVDEQVLPRRFARALLHAAYTDQVDLSLIGRNSSSPSSTNSSGSGTTAWAGGSRGAGRAGGALEDAFQLYEIARFLEMAIVVQGCEDAIVEALGPDSLPAVLRWAAAPHASAWVHRQAMRYLLDEFPSIMSHASCGRVPRTALAEALASPFLQASETQILRALLRWAADQPADRREPNVVWHTAHSVSRRGGRRRDAGDALLRDTLASLLPLVRTEHLAPDNDLMNQLVRRGIMAAPSLECGTALAWLGRGSYRPPRCFLPYLDEIKALLEDQAVPEAELARARHERFLHRIPDTLYMVAAARASGGSAERGAGAGPGAGPGAAACVSPRLLAALRARGRELTLAPPAARARTLHATDTRPVNTQIALRAVREMSLPDSCAELLIPYLQNDRDRDSDEWESTSSERERDRACDRDRDRDSEERWPDEHSSIDCCRVPSGASARCASSGSLRAATHGPAEGSRAGTCRREPTRPDTTQHRQSVSECAASSRASRGRLCAAVPDVAMAPNANTHLLTARDYFRPWEYGGGGGAVLQLDLGDGATHTPRPGSRAARAGSAHGARSLRDPAQGVPAQRARDEDELRAAIELSVIRAYSSCGARAAHTLPHAHVNRSRASASPAGGAPARLHTPPPPHLTLSRLSSGGASAAVTTRSPSPSPARVGGGAGVSGGVAGGSGGAHSPSPRRNKRDLALYNHDYRLEGGSGSGSGGPSPHQFA